MLLYEVRDCRRAEIRINPRVFQGGSDKCLCASPTTLLTVRTSCPFQLLSHFYPSCNHRDHRCLKRDVDVVVSNEDTGYMWTYYHTAEFTASPPFPITFEKLSDVIQGHVMQLSTQRRTICSCQSSNLLVITGGFNFRLDLFLSLYSSVHKAVSMMGPDIYTSPRAHWFETQL